MLKKQIVIGGHYVAKISNKLTTVRVDRVDERSNSKGNAETAYHVTNLATGRTTTFRSAQKFRSEARTVQVGNEPRQAYEPSQFEKRWEGDTPVDAPKGKGGQHEESKTTDTPPLAPLPSEGEKGTDPTAAESAAVGTGKPNGSSTATSVPPTVSPCTGSGSARLTPAVSPLAARLAGRSLTKPTDTVAGYTPTDEQRAVLDAATFPGLQCLVIPAGAGAGKTSTLKMLEQVLPGRGQYTAFNRSLVTESKSKFVKARCSTTHSLAFGAVGKQFAHRLNGPRVRSEQVARQLGIEDMVLTVGTNADGTPASRNLAAGYLAGQVTVAIRRFCQSADVRIGREHFKRIDGIDEPDSRTNSDAVRDYLLPVAEKAWADLSSPTGTLPFNHDVYVKVWQLGQGPHKPMIPADYILLDEAQDTAPVFLDVLKQQTHALLIFVGDSNQAIYEWRGAVDAMRAFPDAPRRQLSQSFRFGRKVADVANSILSGLDEPTDLVLKGLDSTPSEVLLDQPYPNPKCVLTRTNAAAIGAVMAGKARGAKTHLIASVDEVLSFVRAAQDLQNSKPTSHPELGCFNSWAEVVAYSKTDEGADLRLWVRLIDEFGCREIIDTLSDQLPESDADLVVCTAHKSKGREWESVQLAGDFPPAARMTDADRRLLYVAVTRAKLVLDLSGCTPFHAYRDKTTGEETAGIKIVWTAAPDCPVPAPAPVVSVDSIPSANGTTPAVGTNGKASEFTWANYGGKWCVGGPSGHEGQTVKVVRKNGSTSLERLGKVAKQFPERAIYYTEAR